jgi:arylamine N-acetyltransferase
MMNLSKEEAIQFVTSVLGIPDPDRKLREEDRVAFLNEIIKAIYCSVPFQNITLLVQDVADQHVPTMEEIKADLTGKKGGLCYAKGMFGNHLLQALGYDTYMCAGSIKFFDSSNHVICIVRNLTSPGSLHMVDAWCGWPAFEAIPLDFQDESPIYKFSFLDVKFIRKGTLIQRYHWKPGDCYGEEAGDKYIDGWRKMCEFDMAILRDISFFEQPMSRVYKQPGDLSPFMVSFRTVMYKDLKLIAIRDDTLLLEKDDRKVERTKLQSRKEVCEAVMKYFPQFSAKDVMKALDNVNLLE